MKGFCVFGFILFIALIVSALFIHSQPDPRLGMVMTMSPAEFQKASNTADFLNPYYPAELRAACGIYTVSLLGLVIWGFMAVVLLLYGLLKKLEK